MENHTRNYNKKHICTSVREGDVIYFICPTCDYVRTWNLVTGKMNFTGGTMDVLHGGFHNGLKDNKLAEINNNKLN